MKNFLKAIIMIAAATVLLVIVMPMRLRGKSEGGARDEHLSSRI